MTRLLLITSIIILLLFAALTLAVKFDLTTQLDFDTTVKIQDAMPNRLKTYLIGLVSLGSWQVMSILVFATMLLQRQRFWLIGVLYLSIVAIEIIGKILLLHPPPPQFMLLRFQDLNLPPHYVRDVASFPSGHAARAAYFAFLWIPLTTTYLFRLFKELKHQTNQSLQIILPFGFVITKNQQSSYSLTNLILSFLSISFIIFSSFLTVTIGLTKVYLGEHWTSDVVGGWLLGSGLAIGIFPLDHLLSRLTKKPNQRIHSAPCNNLPKVQTCSTPTPSKQPN